MAGHLHHPEEHFESPDLVRDIVIGMSDGLTVPFALAAGLSGAVAQSGLVVTAGLAEMAAGAIAMGLGGYLASRSEWDHYQSEKRREEEEIVTRTHDEEEEIYHIFQQYQVPREAATPVVEALKQNPKAWVDFMMRFELGLEEPNPKRATRSALNIGLSYMVGGFVPLLPYMLVENSAEGLGWSAAITGLALLIFGGVKGYYTGQKVWVSALQTLLIGGIAASAAYGIAKGFEA